MLWRDSRKPNFRKFFSALAFYSLVLSKCSYSTPSNATPLNVTVDDQYGDPLTGQLPTYLPVNRWIQGATCVGCKAKPDVAQAFSHTWHDTTHNPGVADQRSIQIKFNGALLPSLFQPPLSLHTNATYVLRTHT